MFQVLLHRPKYFCRGPVIQHSLCHAYPFQSHIGRASPHFCLSVVMRQTVLGDRHPRSNVQLPIPLAHQCVSDDGIYPSRLCHAYALLCHIQVSRVPVSFLSVNREVVLGRQLE